MNDKNINSEIQALRGIAISAAVASHLGSLFFFGSDIFSNITKYINFWIGVDLFFCISGYVIGRSLIKELSNIGNSTSFLYFSGFFWIKRFFRLMPSAWFWIFLTLVCSFFFNESTSFGTRFGNFTDVISVILQVSNIHFWQCHTEQRNCGVNEFYWSLSLEDQFYILAPFLLYFYNRKIWVYVLSFVVISQIFIFFRSTWTFWGSIRTDGFAIGMLLAIFQDSIDSKMIKPNFLGNKSFRISWICFWLLLILIVPSGSVSFNISPFGLGLASLAIGVVVWTASYNLKYFSLPWPFSNVFEFLGYRSYSIYLSHMFVIYFLKEILFRLKISTDDISNIYLLLTFIILILIVAELNYRYLELRFREIGIVYANNFRKRYSSYFSD